MMHKQNNPNTPAATAKKPHDAHSVASWLSMPAYALPAPTEKTAAHAEPGPVPPQPKQQPSVSAVIAALPPDARTAVDACRADLQSRSKPGPEATAPEPTVPRLPALQQQRLQELAYIRERKAARPAAHEVKQLRAREKALQAQVASTEKKLKELYKIEHPLTITYDSAAYHAQIARAAVYTDAFVDAWDGPLPAGGKPALKAMFSAIAQGTAGMETNWSPKTVKAAANDGLYTGVYQVAWPYISDARSQMSEYAPMKALLQANPKEKALIDLAADPRMNGLPTTSFEGQGAAFAMMAAASYKRFLRNGGTPDQFSGREVYTDHMLGASGALRLARAVREQPNTRGAIAQPDAQGRPVMTAEAYAGNFLVTTAPFSLLNDLNPQRLPYAQVTPQQVASMLRDKFIHARNRMEASGIPPEQLLAFEQAFLPEWRANHALKNEEITRVKAQKAMGLEWRAAADTTGKQPCEILKPMPPMLATNAPRSAPSASSPPSRG